MSKAVSYCALLISVAIVIVLSAVSPNILSDKTIFLKNFVGAELLEILGVILPITLGSAASVHLALNQIEEKHKATVFFDTRTELHSTAFWLIGLFVAAVVTIIVKSITATESWSQSLFNGAALVILEWYVLILIALLQLVFAIKADFDDGNSRGGRE